MKYFPTTNTLPPRFHSDDVLTVREVCDWMNISPPTFYRKKFPFHKIGARTICYAGEISHHVQNILNQERDDV